MSRPYLLQPSTAIELQEYPSPPQELSQHKDNNNNNNSDSNNSDSNNSNSNNINYTLLNSNSSLSTLHHPPPTHTLAYPTMLDSRSSNGLPGSKLFTYGLPIFAYCCSSIMMTVTNKSVLSSYDFKLNFLLLAIQVT